MEKIKHSEERYDRFIQTKTIQSQETQRFSFKLVKPRITRSSQKDTIGAKFQFLLIIRVSRIAFSSNESHSRTRFTNWQQKAREGNGPVDLAFFEVDRKTELLVKNFGSGVLRSLRARSFLVLRLPSLGHVYFSPGRLPESNLLMCPKQTKKKATSYTAIDMVPLNYVKLIFVLNYQKFAYSFTYVTILPIYVSFKKKCQLPITLYSMF